MVAIDRNRVRRSFGRQALEYDGHIDVQSRVVEQFADVLRNMRLDPVRILDIGTGTGALPGRLAGVYPGSFLLGVDLAPEMGIVARRKMSSEKRAYFLSGDGENLPLADGTFDLAVSTSAFQWFDSLDKVFAEVMRVLVPGGTFFFAMFGGDTFCELKDSYRRALELCGNAGVDRMHKFHGVREVNERLVSAGFSDCRAYSGKYLEYHKDVPAFLRALKKIGAGNASGPAPRGLAGRRLIQRMIDLYGCNYSVGGRIQVTYEIIYATGKKQSPK